MILGINGVGKIVLTVYMKPTKRHTGIGPIPRVMKNMGT